jgi:hypothetical protein
MLHCTAKHSHWHPHKHTVQCTKYDLHQYHDAKIHIYIYIYIYIQYTYIYMLGICVFFLPGPFTVKGPYPVIRLPAGDFSCQVIGWSEEHTIFKLTSFLLTKRAHPKVVSLVNQLVISWLTNWKYYTLINQKWLINQNYTINYRIINLILCQLVDLFKLFCWLHGQTPVFFSSGWS